jgi:hypothetical protein
MSGYQTEQKLGLFIQWLRIAVSVRPNLLGASALSPKEGNRFTGFKSSVSDIICHLQAVQEEGTAVRHFQEGFSFQQNHYENL